ncbi:hypothetical protein ACLQ18_39420 [Streptomyces sp. DT193]|uniref:hypothetical protein n=1 Tax=Streptomyces sp. DT193 TaxID=3393418 RepID=UPI003CEE06E3
MTSVEELLTVAGSVLRETRRVFDVGGGLRRLAEDAGYVPPTRDVPTVSRAHHQLTVVARWVLKQPQAAGHVERLAAAIGEDGLEESGGPWEDLDVDGAQAFACMLYLAGHPESAQFWWQLAAGADHRVAAYCLYLHHLGRGEIQEANFWINQLQCFFDGPDDDFLQGMGKFAFYVRRHCPPSPLPQDALTAEVERLATRDDSDDVLVCRPDREIADRLQGCANQR